MLSRQAKTLSAQQIKGVLNYLAQTRQATRNQVIFFLSLKAGLRAKEIAFLTWAMVTDASGEIDDCIRLTDNASKGKSGGVIPMAADLKIALRTLQIACKPSHLDNRVIQTIRSSQTSPQMIVNLFRHWYADLGFLGCSSHSGRRTFITRMARNIGRYGGSMRDVQALARHQSLAMTQRYVELDSEAMRQVVNC